MYEHKHGMDAPVYTFLSLFKSMIEDIVDSEKCTFARSEFIFINYFNLYNARIC